MQPPAKGAALQQFRRLSVGARRNMPMTAII